MQGPPLYRPPDAGAPLWGPPEVDAGAPLWGPPEVGPPLWGPPEIGASHFAEGAGVSLSLFVWSV